jgi:hypothetical protein
MSRYWAFGDCFASYAGQGVQELDLRKLHESHNLVKLTQVSIAGRFCTNRSHPRHSGSQIPPIETKESIAARGAMAEGNSTFGRRSESILATQRDHILLERDKRDAETAGLFTD